MATRSTLAYRNDSGELRGTYVHWDGYPENALPSIQLMLDTMGFEGTREWIETGILAGGYSSYGDENPTDPKPWDPKWSWNCPVDSQDFGYVIDPEGQIKIEHFTD